MLPQRGASTAGAGAGASKLPSHRRCKGAAACRGESSSSADLSTCDKSLPLSHFCSPLLDQYYLFGIKLLRNGYWFIFNHLECFNSSLGNGMDWESLAQLRLITYILCFIKWKELIVTWTFPYLAVTQAVWFIVIAFWDSIVFKQWKQSLQAHCIYLLDALRTVFWFQFQLNGSRGKIQFVYLIKLPYLSH